MDFETLLEEKCPRCHGYGSMPDEKGLLELTCDSCDGHGYALTDIGKNLVKFLEHRGFKRHGDE